MQDRKPWHYREILEGMYLGQELSIRQIAVILETSPYNILYWLRKFEIKTREFKIGDLHRGKHLPESQRKLMSASAKKRFEHKENHPRFGTKHSEETKRKMSESHKRRHQKQAGEAI